MGIHYFVMLIKMQPFKHVVLSGTHAILETCRLEGDHAGCECRVGIVMLIRWSEVLLCRNNMGHYVATEVLDYGDGKDHLNLTLVMAKTNQLDLTLVMAKAKWTSLW